MAKENADGTEKTEQPTGKRRSKARNDGNVAKSQDINVVAGLFAGLIYLLLMGPSMAKAHLKTDQSSGKLCRLKNKLCSKSDSHPDDYFRNDRWNQRKQADICQLGLYLDTWKYFHTADTDRSQSGNNGSFIKGYLNRYFSCFNAVFYSSCNCCNRIKYFPDRIFIYYQGI